MRRKNPARLTKRQEAYCQAFAVTGNGTKSAIEAGYSKKVASVQSSENLDKPIIQNRITELQKATAKRLNITANMVLRRLWKIAKDDNRKDQVRALELVGKHLAMFTDKVTVENKVNENVITVAELEKEMPLSLSDKKKLLAAIRAAKEKKTQMI